MKLDTIRLDGLRYTEGLQEEIEELKRKLEQRLNLNEYIADNLRPVTVKQSPIMRTCLLVSLSDPEPRTLERASSLQMSKNSEPLSGTFFNKGNLREVIAALMKLRYHNVEGDWNSSVFVSKVLAQEILRGRDMLMNEGVLEEWLHFETKRGGASAMDIPILDLAIGKYENGQDAFLDLNSRQITNTQILVAGTTGSGKSNLLAVLLHQLRLASADTHYPVNFLLFDYKGEFSDPQNADWLKKFETDRKAILNPIEHPLPFNPFKDFTGQPNNEVNLFATTLASAFKGIAATSISANMEHRLSDAVVNAYRRNDLLPITFQQIYDEYCLLQPENKRNGNGDSITSVLLDLIRNNIFADTDEIDLLRNCYIINLAKYPKEGIVAKAIVYFTIAKLNHIYELLEKQTLNESRVELRHFTVIDEAHYMLGFENKPLQNLIAVGRNKGMSVILATQNMEQFKSKHFDFFANAQYPLIMKQQQQNTQVLRDLFGVSGQQLHELQAAISGLQKGELITKNDISRALGIGIGKSWKKIHVTHLI